MKPFLILSINIPNRSEKIGCTVIISPFSVIYKLSSTKKCLRRVRRRRHNESSEQPTTKAAALYKYHVQRLIFFVEVKIYPDSMTHLAGFVVPHLVYEPRGSCGANEIHLSHRSSRNTEKTSSILRPKPQTTPYTNQPPIVDWRVEIHREKGIGWGGYWSSDEGSE